VLQSISSKQSANIFDKPGFYHSVIGLAITLINIYTAKKGHWFIIARVTVIIVKVYLGVTSIATFIYDN
jgi:uncharacterized membrane protein